MTAKSEIDDILLSQQTRIDNLILSVGRLVSEAASALQWSGNYSVPQPVIAIDAAQPALPAPGALTNPLARPIPTAGDQTFGEAAPSAPELILPANLDVTDPGTLPSPSELSTSDLFKQTAPSGSIKSFDKSAPFVQVSDLLADVEIPALTELDEIEFLDISVGAAPNIVIPLYTGVIPDANFGATIDAKTQFRQDFNTQLQAFLTDGDQRSDIFVNRFFPSIEASQQELAAALRGVLAGTSTAWTTSVEAAIAERARRRTAEENKRLEAEVRRNVARTGRVLEIATNAALARVQDTVHNANVIAYQEIAERQRDREIQHLQFVMNQLASARDNAVNAGLQYRQWVLSTGTFAMDWAQRSVNAAIEAANLAIRQFNADVERQRLVIQVWQTQAEHATLELQAYQEELKAESLKTEVNKDLIARQEAAIRRDISRLQAAAEQINLAKSKYELRRSTIEQFQLDIEAHKAYLSGKQVEIDAYLAQLEGDEKLLGGKEMKLKLSALRAQIAKDINDVRLQEQASIRGYNQTLGDIFKTNMDRWRQIRADAMEAERLDIEHEKLEHDAYRTHLEFTSRDFRDRLQAQIAQSGMNIDVYKSEVDRVFRLLRESNQTREAISDVNMEGARAMSAMMAALASTVEALVSQIHETTASE